MVVNNFAWLPASDLSRVAKDPDTSELYLDSLALIDDLLCGFFPHRGRPRNENADAVIKDVSEIQRRVTMHMVQSNIKRNLSAARNLRADALQTGEGVPAVLVKIEQFLDNLLEQYVIVAREYA